MLPFKKILAPTDFSEPSFEGLKAADELARHFSAEVRLVHVVSPALIGRRIGNENRRVRS